MNNLELIVKDMQDSFNALVKSKKVHMSEAVKFTGLSQDNLYLFRRGTGNLRFDSLVKIYNFLAQYR